MQLQILMAQKQQLQLTSQLQQQQQQEVEAPTAPKKPKLELSPPQPSSSSSAAALVTSLTGAIASLAGGQGHGLQIIPLMQATPVMSGASPTTPQPQLLLVNPVALQAPFLVQAGQVRTSKFAESAVLGSE